MPFLPLVLVALVTCPPPPAPAPRLSAPEPRPAAAGISLVEAFPPEELALDGDGYVIAVVTVVGTSGPGTNARPPELVVDVERALVGRHAGSAAAVWSPRDHGVDWSGAGAERAMRAWGRTRLASPSVGARFVALVARGAPLRIQATLREPWSEETEARWRARIDDARARRAHERAEETRAAERARAAELERVASADLAALVATSDTIVVATLTTLQHSGESHEVVLHTSESLVARRFPQNLHLVGDESARYVEGTPVLVFARWTRWPSRFGGEVDGLRLVSPRHGILPATPERVAAVRALLAP
ncbi:MAG: hypothetical protein IT385_09515 [Deltaproteobacteria bacterium]|nr:hypothetical protein [Deltaproteobacteria bacterium]